MFLLKKRISVLYMNFTANSGPIEMAVVAVVGAEPATYSDFIQC